MNPPQIELIPIRAAVAADQPTTLDLLVKIVPPDLEFQPHRPPLNLGLVIDRSGSMSGEKMEFARQAASYAVQQLLPGDRVSVTVFDDRVETIIPSTLAADKSGIVRQIQRIQPRGSTALHAGWLEGGIQVSQYLNPQCLNRVILLSDGLANVGQTNPDAIAQDVHGLAKRRVSTTTIGVGDDYDEDLLEAMARSGDGNFYHIQSPEQLPAIFLAELQGLVATLGHTVSLGVEPQPQVEVVDVLNDLDKTSYGRLQLPNLIMGCPISVVVRLKVPAATAETLCAFRLAWNTPQYHQRQVLRATLQLSRVSAAQLQELPLNPEVQQQVALLLAARARQEVVQHIDRGNFQAAQQRLQNAREAVLCAPASSQMLQEAELLTDLEADLSSEEQMRLKLMRKKAVAQSNYRQRSRKDI